MTLLPPNATPLERAVEHGAARLSGLAVPLRELWNPATCPIELLPYLAWALSIDGWSSDWPEAIKRSRVASALAIQRVKGTASSVRAIVESFGGSVALREWWQTVPAGAPHTFNLVLDVEGAVSTERKAAFVDAIVAEVHRAKPVRSSFTLTQALATTGAVGLVGALRATSFARLQVAASPAPSFTIFDFAAAYANTGGLPAGVTLARASTNATQFDSAGVLVTMAADTARFDFDPANGRTNLALRSQDFSDPAWFVQGAGGAASPTITANASNAPDGTATADRMSVPATGAGQVADLLNSSSYTLAAGKSYTASLWVRAVSGASQTYLSIGDGSAYASVLINLTPIWQRVQVTITPGATGSFYFILGFDYRDGAQSPKAAAVFDIWGAQFEIGAAATEYIPTAAVPVTVKSLRGLLIEPSRTNTAIYSDALENPSVWAQNLAALTPNVGNSPTGATTLDRLTETAGGSTYQTIYQQQSPTGPTTLSAVFRAETRTWAQLYIYELSTGSFHAMATFNLSEAGTAVATYGLAKIQPLGNGLYRCSVSATLTGTPCIFALGPSSGSGQFFYPGNGSSVQAGCVQIESGTSARSFIATGSDAATRAVDVLKLAGGSGTFLFTFDDFSTETIDLIAVGGLVTVPTNLSRPWIRSVVRL